MLAAQIANADSFTQSILWAAVAGAVLFAELPGAAFLIAGLLILGGAMIATPARRKAATFAANRLG